MSANEHPVTITADSSMKHVVKKDNSYTQIPVNTTILFTDEQLDHMYEKFHDLKSLNLFTGSFTEFCTYCFSACANTYLLTFADFISEVRSNV